MKTNLLTLVVTLTVSIILVGSLMMPIIASAQKDNIETFSNHGYPVSEIGTGTISFSISASEGIVTADGTIAPAVANSSPVALAADSGMISSDLNGTKYFIYRYGSTLTTTTNITAMDVSVDGSTKTISVSNVTASSTVADFTFTYSEWCFVPDVDGTKVAYRAISTPSTFYIKDDAKIYSAYHNSTWYAALENETIKATSSDSVTVTTHFSKTAFKEDVSTFIASTGTDKMYYITAGGSDYNPDYIVLDKQVQIITAQANAMIALYAAIPLIIIVGLVVYALRSFSTRD